MVETRGGRRFTLFFLFAAFLVLLLGRWITPIDSVALTVAAPFGAVASGVAGAVGDTISGVVDGPRYRQENAVLQHQIGVLIHQNLLLQQARHDNAMLQRMVKFDDL